MTMPAEENMKIQDNLLSLLLDNIPDCIAMILRKDTREIVASNSVAQRIGH